VRRGEFLWGKDCLFLLKIGISREESRSLEMRAQEANRKCEYSIIYLVLSCCLEWFSLEDIVAGDNCMLKLLE
jgi:hypothetical protein